MLTAISPPREATSSRSRSARTRVAADSPARTSGSRPVGLRRSTISRSTEPGPATGSLHALSCSATRRVAPSTSARNYNCPRPSGFTGPPRQEAVLRQQRRAALLRSRSSCHDPAIVSRMRIGSWCGECRQAAIRRRKALRPEYSQSAGGPVRRGRSHGCRRVPASHCSGCRDS
jgi:hypothetical protein